MRTTTPRAGRTPFAPELVERNFTPEAPDRLWVADITYLGSWEGWMYLAFVPDAYSPAKWSDGRCRAASEPR